MAMVWGLSVKEVLFRIQSHDVDIYCLQQTHFDSNIREGLPAFLSLPWRSF